MMLTVAFFSLIGALALMAWEIMELRKRVKNLESQQQGLSRRFFAMKIGKKGPGDD